MDFQGTLGLGTNSLKLRNFRVWAKNVISERLNKRIASKTKIADFIIEECFEHFKFQKSAKMRKNLENSEKKLQIYFCLGAFTLEEKFH